MEYTLRKEIFPIFFQRGFHTIKNGLSVGVEEKLDDEPICALHYHQCIELGICVSGCGESHIEDHVYSFGAGDISCVRAGVPHMSRSDGSDCSWIWVFINPFDIPFCDGATVAETVMKLSEKGFCGVFSPDEHPELANHLKELIFHKNNDEQGLLEKSLIALRIIFEMARIGDIDNCGECRKSFGRLENAINFIRENYTDDDKMTCEEISKACGLSQSHFRSLFKKLLGMTVTRYINKTRLSSAVYLLRVSDKSITDIAFDSGFSDVSYFNRLFRKEFGLSPREMRKGFDTHGRIESL